MLYHSLNIIIQAVIIYFLCICGILTCFVYWLKILSYLCIKERFHEEKPDKS